MKQIDARIAYYTKKVAEFTSWPRSKPIKNKYRHDRLMLYKRLMHAEIKYKRG